MVVAPMIGACHKPPRADELDRHLGRREAVALGNFHVGLHRGRDIGLVVAKVEAFELSESGVGVCSR